MVLILTTSLSVRYGCQTLLKIATRCLLLAIWISADFVKLSWLSVDLGEIMVCRGQGGFCVTVGEILSAFGFSEVNALPAKF